MPLYEYHCQTCSHDFELLLRGDESPVCPQCAETVAGRLIKQFSVPAGHVAGGSALPIAGSAGGCGRPSCGMGGCAGGL